MGGEAHGFTRGLFLDPSDLVDHPTRTNDGHPGFDGALATSLTDLERLLGDRLVGENPNPELAAAADVAGDGATAGLNLAGGEPARPKSLQAIIAEGDVVAGCRHTTPAAAVRFAELRP